MVTCFIRYKINVLKLDEFEQYARMWLEIVPRYGGVHHG